MDSSSIQQIVGESLIVLGLGFAAFGVYAILKLDRFYLRLVVTSKVETMAFLTILFGAMVITGLSFMTIKIFIILLFEILTLPVGSHAVARSAYVSGFRANTVTWTEDSASPANDRDRTSAANDANESGGDNNDD